MDRRIVGINCGNSTIQYNVAATSGAGLAVTNSLEDTSDLASQYGHLSRRRQILLALSFQQTRRTRFFVVESLGVRDHLAMTVSVPLNEKGSPLDV
jgi:hypothetical protein